ncbi:hypothetical protein OG552_19275 [Streptomyces sp. NBC_01476]|uniref:hypothetical protein n=1 Tax=Streptomyces sp. NBC_01476 TaxID=2903881 RepID=UPI002E37A039|nr:hypothetical protein [Streptomyces sp. NBC_01476]
MTENNEYASRPDYLPDFMNNPEDGDGRQVMKLGWAESRELEAVSLNRFPPTFSAALDWDSASYRNRIWWDDEEDWARMASELLSSCVERGMRVAIFWGNLVLPTVTLPADVAVRHAREILDVGPHFWIYPLGGSVLIECLMDGQVTIASIPEV